MKKQETPIQCKQCGNALTIKELLTMDIYGEALCDICVGTARRKELIIQNYERRLSGVPARYVSTKYSEERLSRLYKESILLTADSSVRSSIQMGWDLIKFYWKRGEDAMYASAQTMSIEYRSCPWQQKPDIIEKYASHPAFVMIEGIDHTCDKEIMTRVTEYRAERNLLTMIITPFTLDKLSPIIGIKSSEIISEAWTNLELDT